MQRERKHLENPARTNVLGGELTKLEVKALVTALRDIVGVLRDADPADEAELYAELGVPLSYHPTGASPWRRSRVG